MEVDKKVYDKYIDIVFFLKECVKNDWLLNKDDIDHIIKGDFDFVRKQYDLKR